MGRSVERKGGPAYSKGACPETNRREKAVRPGQDGPGARLTAGVTQSTRQQNCWARGGSTSLDPAAPPKAAPGGVVVGRQPTRLAPSSALPGIARIAAPRRAGGAPMDRASALLPGALAGRWCGDIMRFVAADGPIGSGFLAEGADGGTYGGEEMIGVNRAGQPVTFDLAPYWVLEFGEYQGNALVVQRLVQVFEHVGGGGVHVRHRLGRDDDPERLRLGRGEPPDLVAERLGVGEEQWGIEPVDHQAR